MGYLDSAGLAHFTSWVRSRLSGKQDALTPDGSVSLQGGNIGVASPVQGVVTQAEFDALPEAERNKGLYVIPDSGGGSGGGSSEEVYSTEEAKVGTWIDGKPVYQRTFSFTSPASSAAATVFSIPNIGALIQFHGYLVAGSGDGIGFIPIPFDNGSMATIIWCNGHDGAMRMQVTSDTYRSKQCYMTVRYTKTTDEGVAA